MTFRKWLREPLVHFLAAGLAMFAIASWWGPRPEEGRSIAIGRTEFLTYLQGRAQLYDEEGFVALIERLPRAQRLEMLREAALQEALYREGEALNLAGADPLVRQRVVQQMRLLLMEEASAEVRVTDAEVRRFYTDNQADYAEPALASFTHVFLSTATRGAAAEAAARAMLAQLRANKVPFERAGQHGDRFLYQLNYADAGTEEIASQFGAGFAGRLFALEPGAWQGPLKSDHGWHLVLLSRKSAPRAAPFETVAARVREDALAAKREKLANAAMERLLERYDVRYEDGLDK